MIPRSSDAAYRLFRPILLAVLTLVLFVPPAWAIIGVNYQMLLGNPSGATVDPNNHNHYLIQRSVEAMDYSDNLGEAVWVSWNLTPADFAGSSGGSPFSVDTSLPAGFYKVPTDAYSGSGYSRGHMCPNADRDNSSADNQLVYLMSNMVPQDQTQNGGVWADFEGDCRTWAGQGNEVLIICGPGGFGTNYIGNGRVAVPQYTWKIAVPVPTNGSGDAISRITPFTRTIAIKVPNNSSVSSDWHNYITTAHQIETDTGFTFFTALSPDIASALRYKVDGLINPPPSIAGFAPGSGVPGSSVVIAGTNLASALMVKFNGANAAFSVDSTTQITAIVPANATSGQITVSTLSGTNSSVGSYTVGTASYIDLALLGSHTGTFTQGDIGNTYTMVVTNTGTLATTGTVTVVDTLPAGLTATALSGLGWTTTLETLTCTRSDSLPPGASYPPITLTVNVAQDAPSLVTNLAMLSGGGDSFSGNNAATDVTAVVGSSTAQLLISQVYGGGGNSGAVCQNDFVELYNRGANTLDLNGWSLQYAAATGTNWNPINLAGTLGPSRHYLVRLGSTGTNGFALPAADITNALNISASDGKLALVSNQSALSAANPIGLPDVVDFVGYGNANAWEGTGSAPSPSATLAIFRLNDGATDTDSNAADFAPETPYPRSSIFEPVMIDLMLELTHAGNFTQGDAAGTYTIVVTNRGGAASTGVVTVSNSLPAGLVATAMSGSGWTTDQGALTCTRSDSLGGNGSFPPITLTVSVAANAAANLVASATVSGGGDAYAVNNAATDPTTIIPALPPVVSTGAASSVSNTTAMLSGTVAANNQLTTARFEYGATTNYGAVALVSGTFNGTNTQYVATALTNLSLGALYHFRLTASNVLGSATGLDQTFTTTAPDMSIALTHTGSFTQGDLADTYTLVVTNLGNGPSAGTVTISSFLPSGLTPVAISGTGWTPNLAALTCARSDLLAPGGSYPPVTLTVSVAANAPALVTTAATVSGGGDVNLANNTASDLTVITQSTFAGGATNIVISQVYGAGGNSGAAYRNDFVELFNPLPTAVDLSTWSVQYTSATGNSWGNQKLNLTCSIQPYHYYLIQFGSGGSTGVALPAADATNSFNMSASSGKIALVSHQTALTNSNPVGANGVVDFVGYGAADAYEGTAAAPTPNGSTNSIVRKGGGFFDSNTNSADFVVASPPTPRNSATDPNPPAQVAKPDLAVSLIHSGTFKQGDTNSTYTIIVTNCGTADSIGIVTVTNILPAGISATAISGTGWITSLAGLSCQRSDTLAAGSAYDPVTVTVSVAVDAPATVTNIATVFGSNEITTLNNTVMDVTPIAPLAPVEVWRWQWFGTTANSGNAADNTVLTGDGLPNLVKYALGLNPLTATNSPVIYDITTGYLRVTVPRNTNATDVTFRVEVTGSPAGGWTTNSTTVDVNTPALLQVRDNYPVAASLERYMRLRVSRP